MRLLKNGDEVWAVEITRPAYTHNGIEYPEHRYFRPSHTTNSPRLYHTKATALRNTPKDGRAVKIRVTIIEE